MTERQNRGSYVSMALRVSKKYSRRLPVIPENICRMENIPCIPLSQYVSKGMTEKEVFSIWRNCDGVMNLLISGNEKRCAISYNDRCAPHRIRFTLAEELMHYFLGHAEDPRNSYNSEEYSEECYERCEQEAKNGACILLCPPVFFYNYRPSLTEISHICNVSRDCAASMRRFFIQNEKEITGSFEYFNCEMPALSFDPRHKKILFEDGYEL